MRLILLASLLGATLTGCSSWNRSPSSDATPEQTLLFTQFWREANRHANLEPQSAPNRKTWQANKQVGANVEQAIRGILRSQNDETRWPRLPADSMQTHEEAALVHLRLRQAWHYLDENKTPTVEIVYDVPSRDRDGNPVAPWECVFATWQPQRDPGRMLQYTAYPLRGQAREISSTHTTADRVRDVCRAPLPSTLEQLNVRWQ